MPKFAQYDPEARQPAPVTGWYDTDFLDYPNLPQESCLVELSEVQWIMHFNDPNRWSVQNGRLVEND